MRTGLRLVNFESRRRRSSHPTPGSLSPLSSGRETIPMLSLPGFADTFHGLESTSATAQGSIQSAPRGHNKNPGIYQQLGLVFPFVSGLAETFHFPPFKRKRAGIAFRNRAFAELCPLRASFRFRITAPEKKFEETNHFIYALPAFEKSTPELAESFPFFLASWKVCWRSPRCRLLFPILDS